MNLSMPMVQINKNDFLTLSNPIQLHVLESRRDRDVHSVTNILELTETHFYLSNHFEVFRVCCN